MGVKVAYGRRANINSAIAVGAIPMDSIIITSDGVDSAELMFYDAQTNLKHIVSKTKFQNIEEAKSYVGLAGMVGQIVAVLDGDRYDVFVIQPDGVLEPLQGESSAPDIAGNLVDRIEQLERYAHAHGNKTLLDSLTADLIQRWNEAATLADSISDGLQLVKGTDDVNGVTIHMDGAMTVNKISLNRIVQLDDEELIINGN